MSIASQLVPKIQAAGAARHLAAVKLMEEALDRRVPVDTGHLKHSRHSVTRPGPVMSTVIYYDAKYADIIDTGPKAHVIRARNAKTLRFKAGGKILYRKKVNWRPGPGVARNKGFFSKTVVLRNWTTFLRAAGAKV